MLHKTLTKSTVLLLLCVILFASGALITLSTDNIPKGFVASTSPPLSFVPLSDVQPPTNNTNSSTTITSAGTAGIETTTPVTKKGNKQKLYDEYTGEDFNEKKKKLYHEYTGNNFNKKKKDKKDASCEDKNVNSSSNSTTTSSSNLKALPPLVQYSKRRIQQNDTVLQISNTSLPTTSSSLGNSGSSNKQHTFTTPSSSASIIPSTTAMATNSEATNFESTKIHADTHPLALGLGLGFGFLAICMLTTLLVYQRRRNRKIGSSSIGVYFTKEEKEEEPYYHDEKKEKERISAAPSFSSRKTSVTLRPSSYLDSSNNDNNSNINTRWRVTSFLNVVASVAAKLPSHHRSSSSPQQQALQQQKGDDNCKQLEISYPDVQFPPRVSSLREEYMRLP